MGPLNFPGQWAEANDHPLQFLDGRLLGRRFRLRVLVGQRNRVGAQYFQLLLENADGPRLLALGLWHKGPFPSHNWLELVRYLAHAHGPPPFPEHALFALLGKLVPPGGSLMVEYESPGLEETRAILALGYPPACTPLGHLLLRAGCATLRDWYISEGGAEGPRKLQGFLPLNPEIAARAREGLRDVLAAVVGRPLPPGPWHPRAHLWAVRSLRFLQRYLP